VQVVQGDHIGTPVGQEPIDEVTSDKPGATGYNSFCRVYAHAAQYRVLAPLERFSPVENKLSLTPEIKTLF
jgi:hypothetical protein